MTRTQIEEAERRRVFGLALASARRQHNLTQRELAANLALSEDRLGNLERGICRPGRAEVAAIVDALPSLTEAAANLRLYPRLITLPRPIVPGRPAHVSKEQEPEPTR